MTPIIKKTSVWSVFVALFMLVSSANAQSGSIIGTIIDGDFGDTLIGANVLLDNGSLRGTTTDMNGYFEINSLTPGSYNVRISFIGYVTIVVQDIEVVERERTRIEVTLEPESFDLGEVVVEARMILDNESTLLRERQKSGSMSDAISAETISRSGSSNAADAMEKVTGASVIDGKYVYVRGLGDRYSTTQMNGIDLPSSDPDKKSVHFDLFPSEMLENIVTIKTFTPDKPGSFSGGLVDIGTKSYPDELTVKLSFSSSANTSTHFRSDYLTMPGANIGIIASSGTSFDLPSLLSSTNLNLPSAVRARRDAGLANQLDLASKSFNPYMEGSSATAPMNTKASLTVGNQVELFNRKLGFVVSASHSHTASGYNDGEIGRYSYSGTVLTPDVLFNDVKGTEEVSVGLLSTVNYKLATNHEIGATGMYSRNAESQARFQVGTWPKEFGNEAGLLFVNNALKYSERDLYSGQVRGKHFLPFLAKSTLEWSGSLSSTNQNEPDTRFFAYTQRTDEEGNIGYSASSSGFSDPSRYFRDLTENASSFQADLSIPFDSWTGKGGVLKLGTSNQLSDRSFSERIFVYSIGVPYTGQSESFFGPESLGIINFDESRNQYAFGNTIRDGSKTRNNYTGDLTISGSYAMVELPLASWARIIGGVRLESTDLTVVSQDSTVQQGLINERDVLPSVNMVFPVSKTMNIRAAFTKTLARPTFREIAPFSSFDFILGNYRIGNPDLELTRITNYDLRWEWFRKAGEIVAFSVFYKDMQDAIEEVIIGGTNGQLQYQNVNQATILGAEIELRSTLDAIPVNFFKHLSLGLNTSFIKSNVDIAETELAVRRAIDPNASSRRDLQGQSPFIVNTDLTYENTEKQFTGGMYFNVFGQRLSSVSLGGTPDVFERPSPQLDMTFSKGFSRGWSAKLSVKNVLDSAFEQTYRFEGNDYTYYSYNKGRSFSLGFSYSPF
jgi:hypothetical protein